MNFATTLACVAGGFKGWGWGAGNENYGGEAREGENAGDQPLKPPATQANVVAKFSPNFSKLGNRALKSNMKSTIKLKANFPTGTACL
jgi:hypothetical protein